MIRGHVFLDVLYMYNTDHAMTDVKYIPNPHPHRHGTTKFNQASRLKSKRG